MKRARGGRLDRRGVMPLPPRRGRVPVVLEHLSSERAALRDLPGISIPIVRELRDLPVTDPVMIAPGQQRRPSRGAHRRGVKAVEPDALLVDLRQRVGAHLAAERVRQPRARVIDQHDQDVRRILGQPARLDAVLIRGLLHRPPSTTRRRGRWKRKHVLRPKAATTTSSALAHIISAAFHAPTLPVRFSRSAHT